MIFSRRCRFALFLACVWTVGVAGCGDSTAEVSGTITLKGKPPNLKGLEIGFLGGKGRLVTAPVAADGTYKVGGVPVGEVMVSFIYTPTEPAQAQGKGRLLRPGPDGPPTFKAPSMDQTKNPIPESLWDGSTSKLSFKVAPGPNNVFNYNVQP